MHQFDFVLDIVKLQTQEDLLIPHLLGNAGLRRLLILDEPDGLVLLQVDLDRRPLPICDGHATLPRVAPLPYIPAV
jgi:hypothetical protein